MSCAQISVSTQETTAWRLGPVRATPNTEVTLSSAMPPKKDSQSIADLRSVHQITAPGPSRDRIAGPLLEEAGYGEHGVAFLSGNYQPLVEETTAILSIPSDFPTTGPDGSAVVSGNAMHVEGELPLEFPNGKFIYVGPNPKFSRDHYKVWGRGPRQRDIGFSNGWHHWFEGDGMIYALDFESMKPSEAQISDRGTPGEVQDNCTSSFTKETGAFYVKHRRGRNRRLRYRNRYVRTNSWHDELRSGSRLFRPLMNTSGLSFLPHAIANLFLGGNFLKDSANTALTFFAGRLLTLQDTMPPWEIDTITLETRGPCDFGGTLPFYVPFTAHPKVAPDSGDLVFFGFNPVYPPHCTVGTINSSGTVGQMSSLWHNALQGATFMHDFCVTKKYTVLFEGSMNIRPLRMFRGEHPLQYDEDQVARFGLLKRGGVENSEKVVWCDCSTAEMVYHFINAWEDEDTGEIVIVGVREDGFFLGALAANGTREWISNKLKVGRSVPRIHEWRINPTRQAVTSERWLFDLPVEVPRINDAYTGIKNRFTYAGKIHTGSLTSDAQLKFDALVKFDLQNGESEIYEYGYKRYGMEAQFVPRNKSRAESQANQRMSSPCSSDTDHAVTDMDAVPVEDDGWIVLYVHDESKGSAEGRSECLVLDAKNIQAGPIVRIVLPSRIPYGAHALWCTAKGVDYIDSFVHDSVMMTSESLANCSTSDLINESTTLSTSALNNSKATPRLFTFAEEQTDSLLGTVRTGVLRAGAGLFVNGWRPCISPDVHTEYSLIRAFGFRFMEARALGKVREDQVKSTEYLSRTDDPLPTLTLYELEGCGACRRVREAICMLDVACVMRPCPLCATRNRLSAAMAQLGVTHDSHGSVHVEDAQLPYLEDSRTGAKLTGADSIITYLYSEYLDGAVPSPLVRPGLMASICAQVAVNARGTADGYPSTTSSYRRGPAGAFYSRPSHQPTKPLQLWAYEASPFCSVVREALSQLELPYVLQPCARGSPRRTQLMHRSGGKFQVPYLEDANTGTAMFESAEIIKYLRTEYSVP